MQVSGVNYRRILGLISAMASMASRSRCWAVRRHWALFWQRSCSVRLRNGATLMQFRTQISRRYHLRYPGDDPDLCGRRDKLSAGLSRAQERGGEAAQAALSKGWGKS